MVLEPILQDALSQKITQWQEWKNIFTKVRSPERLTDTMSEPLFIFVFIFDGFLYLYALVRIFFAYFPS